MNITNIERPAQAESTPSNVIPDYLADPNAVLGDSNVKWRYGRAPDYSKTRKVYEATKQGNHVPGSLEEMVENLVKNWEVEASFKTQLSDWRTVDHEKYTFAINGGPPQSGEHMLKVGTYNAIISPNEYYSPENSDFVSSHKTFKRMMPTFAWEVLEVYSGPPLVAFKWRHWGTMKNDYVGFNDKGEKVTAKAHGGSIDITGITIATVDDKVRLQDVNTYFDPMDMFRQIAPNGVVNKQIVENNVSSPGANRTERNSAQGACPFSGAQTDAARSACPVASSLPHSMYSSSVTGNVKERAEAGNKIDYSAKADVYDSIDQHLESSAEVVHPHPKTMEKTVKPAAGEAVAAGPRSEETRMTHEEMSRESPSEYPFLMNRE